MTQTAAIKSKVETETPGSPRETAPRPSSPLLQFEETRRELARLVRETSGATRPVFEFLRDQKVRGRLFERERQEMLRAVRPLSGKWTFELVYLLCCGETWRFNELRRGLRGISSRTLSRKLQTLVEGGYVRREVRDGVPVQVAYSLTERGRGVAELFALLHFYLRFYPPPDGAEGPGTRR